MFLQLKSLCLYYEHFLRAKVFPRPHACRARDKRRITPTRWATRYTCPVACRLQCMPSPAYKRCWLTDAPARSMTSEPDVSAATLLGCQQGTRVRHEEASAGIAQHFAAFECHCAVTFGALVCFHCVAVHPGPEAPRGTTLFDHQAHLLLKTALFTMSSSSLPITRAVKRHILSSLGGIFF